jgi:hypothetical protein
MTWIDGINASASPTGRPVIQSFEPNETWFWSYQTGSLFEGPALAPPTSHPWEQSVPGPVDRLPERRRA